jgi:phosphatidylserine/phosphatidylglycerophosphate/cardiolipin synthase-like enzyme
MAGVDVRVLGKMGKRAGGLKAEKFPVGRLHVRAMVRDGDTAFVGSQSLRALELDGRREVGLIVKDPKVIKRLTEVFEADWGETSRAEKEQKQAAGEPELAEAGTG